MRRLVLLSPLSAIIISISHARPLIDGASEKLSDKEWAWNYLKHFGYIQPKKTMAKKAKILSNAIADFQTFAGLNVTCGYLLSTIYVFNITHAQQSVFYSDSTFDDILFRQNCFVTDLSVSHSSVNINDNNIDKYKLLNCI